MLGFALILLVGAFLPLVSCGPLVTGAPHNSSSAAAGMATVYTSCTTKNFAALTFDDGPWVYEVGISNLLRDNNVSGTFFVSELPDGCIYDDDIVTSIQSTFRAGHQIASHTWSHPDLNTLSADQSKSPQITPNRSLAYIQISFSCAGDPGTRWCVALKKVLGIKTRFLRPPYGNFNDRVRQVAAQNDKDYMVTWNFDSGDSVGESYQNSEKDYAKFLGGNPDSMIALNHETMKNTAHYLVQNAINQIKAKGYQLVTVAQCLGIDAYESSTGLGTKDDTWACEDNS
ncbi:unnamed protein product [Mycena citricolor]|uniref:NodB homology domain-containing protein n=1 Tax=Mycena citricolor TaxID=2018698 RepID=A0AAD2JYV4_9AGAR|nr:unnamed protein product [Mycena citricolor]